MMEMTTDIRELFLSSAAVLVDRDRPHGDYVGKLFAWLQKLLNQRFEQNSIGLVDSV